MGLLDPVVIPADAALPEPTRAPKLLLPRDSWQWDERLQRYRYPPKAAGQLGRLLPPETVAQLVERQIEKARQEIEDLTERLLAGKMSVAEWQRAMAQVEKDVLLTARMLGAGGKAGMTFRDYGVVGNRLRREYSWLADFGQEIARGELSPERIRQRALFRASANVRAMFASAQLDSHKDAGYGFERSNRTVGKDSCQDCINEEQRGLYPIGDGKFPGERKCGPNCGCSLEYWWSREQRYPPLGGKRAVLLEEWLGRVAA